MNIKFVVGAAVVLAVIYFFPAFQHMQMGRAISGSTLSEVKKSAVKVRRKMSTEERNRFDTAFGILEKIKGDEGQDAFVKSVSGLDSEQIVELAKQEVEGRIASGQPEFKQYSSWDDMIAKLTGESGKKGVHQGQDVNSARTFERPSRPN
jgi:hypothetical protein